MPLSPLSFLPQRQMLGNPMPQQNQMRQPNPMQLQALLRMLQGNRQASMQQQPQQMPMQQPQQDGKKNLSSFLNIMKTLVQSGQLNG
ncbi:MAG: hypothetical protein KKH44_00775 [Bacteroidetes bacterium]|nr:hypothetical protein [Bacteroidota bacterium]